MLENISELRTLTCNACTAWYCYGRSVRPSVCPSSAGTVSKLMDISSHFGRGIVVFRAQLPFQNSAHRGR